MAAAPYEGDDSVVPYRDSMHPSDFLPASKSLGYCLRPDGDEECLRRSRAIFRPAGQTQWRLPWLILTSSLYHCVFEHQERAKLITPELQDALAYMGGIARDNGMFHFSWAEGYGAFSIGISQIETTVAYIQNQQEHHRQKTF